MCRETYDAILHSFQLSDSITKPRIALRDVVQIREPPALAGAQKHSHLLLTFNQLNVKEHWNSVILDTFSENETE